MDKQNCKYCGELKLLDEFYKHKKYKNGHTTICKSCKKIKAKELYDKTRDRILEQKREYHQNNRDRELKRMKEWQQNNKNHIKIYRKNHYNENINDILEYQKQYRKNNREKCNAYRIQYEKNRRARDPQYKIYRLLSCRTRQAIIKGYKNTKTKDLIGCDMNILKQFLEFQFNNNMSWDNYGSYWQIDHVIPCASFDLCDIEQQKICFNWQNLQPLESIQNNSKNNKIDKDLIEYQKIKVSNFLNTLSYSTKLLLKNNNGLE